MSLRRSIILFLIGLIFFLIGVYINSTSGDSGALLISSIEHKVEKNISEVEREASGLLGPDSSLWNSVSHSFFLMDSSQVIRWSRNDFLPDVRTVQDDFSIRLLRWPRGIFLLRKWKLDGGRFLLGVLPLRNQYKINNRYLVSEWNEKIFSTQDIIITDPVGEGYPFFWEGKVIFKIRLSTDEPQTVGFNWLSFGLLCASVLFLLAGFYLWIKKCQQEKRYGRSLISIIVFFVGGRILSLILLSPPDIPLFDPTLFASSSYNRSIGDLFFNSLCVSIPVIYFFYNFPRLRLVKHISALVGIPKHLVAILLLLLCYLSVLLPYLFFETIFHNSAISLDMTQSLNFDAVRIFSFLSIVLGCVSAFMLIHVFTRIAFSLVKKGIGFIMHLSATIILFLLYSILVQRDYLVPLISATWYLLLILFMSLPKYLKRTTYTTFLYLFIAIITFSLQGAFAIKKFVVEDKIASQFRFANAFLTDRDYLGEYLLSESVQRISSDPFIQTRLGSPFLSKAVVRQKVKQVYLSSYFDRYDIKIHLFNPTGASYDNSTSLSFTEMITNFQQEASKTNYEGVFFLKNSTAESTKRYLVVIPISRFSMVTGYVVLDLSLKRVIPRNVFPELLLDDRFIQYFKNRDFSYAFYIGNQVTSSFGDYNFERDFVVSSLSDPKLYTNGINFKGFIHVGVEDEQGNTTIVSSSSYPDFNIITNFSFLFIIGLFIILFGLLFYGAFTLYKGRALNYSARIQLYVYLAFILPLVMVSATTLGLISRSAERQLTDEYVEKSKTIGERLASIVDNFLDNPEVSANDLENQLIDLAKLANVDASIFLPTGKLLASSQPLIYDDRILSSLMNRDAFDAIVWENDQSFVNNEQIGFLSYNCSYYAIRSPESGALIGIVSLPFFESAYSLEKTQISVVANIITIFCIVFILFSILSFFAVRWLTFPLEFITRILRRTKLTESNKPLVWNANDEIGMMVNEYNKMVDNLEQSKIELSRIQKESAWREIAKQVAHEVKNPLTPMKLTLQQMERALINNDLSKETTKKSLQTILQQVEILNEIAASFSAFARMPAPILQKVEITSLVKKVSDLHSDYKEGFIRVEVPESPVFIMGDEQLLSRVFSNIILNALQSREDGHKINIDVSVKESRGNCLISFKDNGNGIDAELSEKIFVPHFSTKKSGSGLGLAIAKQGIEQSGGRIWFETRHGEGTTFFIEIPISG